ncbi:GIY-YIG nuclease family protein [Mycoplasma sp. M5725]|uniref:Excinuclease cho n=1 Tax=Mycoplasma phocimorsus TaxID=3045839 RepID=A0AAJ1PTF7_9MOLU|nr:GIY-YIG nuclease family protein [Mycoplasma phocimorsus]MDJ1645877.1 GIY-YIG nuclease family protein [Mycoplasma phocimorsus]MDJ1647977.1 GIY-YIG nuclease family protein [Mycoplasma phocimorsus]
MLKINEIRQLDSVLNSPGIYIWLDANQEIMYIGKAIKLKNRMKQYFKGRINSFKTETMVNKIYYFSVMYTRNEREALKLEQELIKKHRPRYNILLLDDRKYPYLNINYSSKTLLFKRIYHSKDTGFTFGPFIPHGGIKQLIDNLSSKYLYENGIKIKIVDEKYWESKYNEIIFKLKNIKKFKTELENNIEKYSNNLEFELANEDNKLLETLNSFNDVQNIEINKTNNIDVLAFEKNDDILYVQTLYYRGGMQLSSNFIIAKTELNFANSINEYIFNNYYNSDTQLILDTNIKDIILENYKITFPQRGELKMVFDLCKLNLSNNIKTFISQQKTAKNILLMFNKLLKIKINNFLILDISHTSQKDKIGAINTYINGILQNNLNRYFKLSSKSNSDFYLMKELGEIITKHHLISNWNIDTIFVDGAKAQIKAIKETINNEINIIGIVKNEYHIAKYLIFKNIPIFIENSNLLNYIKNIQYKVDKLAKIKMNKAKIKSYFVDTLLNIPGIGEATVNKLISNFSTYEAIENASLNELCECVGNKFGKKIYDYLK